MKSDKVVRLSSEENIKLVSNYIKENKKLITVLGEVTELKQIGQGGNGLVYSGLLNKIEVAIKFLVEGKQAKKLERFKAEYFNVCSLENKKNIVNSINYEEIFLDDYSIPIIVMSKYEYSLSRLRKVEDANEETFIKLFNFLITTLKNIHDNGIIHRDIKPENILVSHREEFFLTDFGIANYNSDKYSLRAKTQNGERMGNYEFSAPEQAKKGVIPSIAMDIYALGQVCHWYVHGETHKGTNRKRITHVFNSSEAENIEEILNKCLYNDDKARFQSIAEIIDYKEELEVNSREVDPYEDMYLLNKVIRATCPSVSNGLRYITEEKYIRRLINNINNSNFNEKLCFNTGRGNSSFSRMEYLENNHVILDDMELKIKGVWFYTASIFDDLIILETDDIEPFVLKDEKTYSALLVNKEHVFPSHYVNSGYIELGDTVYNLNDLETEVRDRTRKYNYLAIGTNYHCSIILENDYFLDELQELKTLNERNIFQLISDIRKAKHMEVMIRL